jgi:hypothetical protein
MIVESLRNARHFGIRQDCQAFVEVARRKKRRVVTRRKFVVMHCGME